ncbi:MAG TPA: Gx transporter family protein [Treponemataceae bacterium]|nr:Gx transporter family protein [Treponemataceae bacterium]
MKNNETRNIIIAWFGALCFFLSTIEYMIPKPLPFLRIGLANLPVMLAIDILPIPSFLILITIKILGQGIITGTLFSYIFLFSATGTLSSALIMYAFRKFFPNRMSFAGISVIGAFTSNAAQLLLARWFIFGPSTWYIAPPFFAVGVFTGTILGLFANHFAKESLWYVGIKNGSIKIPVANPILTTNTTKKTTFFNTPIFRITAGFIFLFTLLFAPNIAVQASIVIFSVLLLLLSSKKIALVPVLLMSVSIIFFNLLSPFGKILAEPFGLKITEGALLLGIKKALTVEGMIFISRWMLLPGFSFPGKGGILLGQTFMVLRHLTERKSRFNPKEPIRSIDAIMSLDD